MSKINYGRLVTGGILAGIVVNLCEFLINGVWLKDAWAEAMKAMNRSPEMGGVQIAVFNIWGFLMGLSAVWLYTQIRDRYGPGLRTAICAALAIWVIGYFAGMMTGVAMGMFPAQLMLIGTVAGLAEIILGTTLGAWFYRPAA
jgi:hypothetical protein